MTDVPFGFALPGGVPDPNDPQQMARFIAQLQQMFSAPSAGPVNWDLARQLA
ncbi:MAG: zinc-dependent metalloprotease, partial [Micromonosporaceae bacterium]